MKVECPFWKVCGPAPIHQLQARREFLISDPRSDHVAMICNDKNHLRCAYYKIRAKPKGVEENEAE